jgi:hypothetical protein
MLKRIFSFLTSFNTSNASLTALLSLPRVHATNTPFIPGKRLKAFLPFDPEASFA